METISVTEAKNTLSELTRKIAELGQTVTITKRGKPYVVMVSADEYENIMETVEILSDADAVAAIQKGRQEIKTGRKKSLEAVRHKLFC